eukprot:1988156-Prymnesium_polylepis.1
MCGGDAVIRAPAGEDLFIGGENVLAVTVENGGQSANPMGFYVRGTLRDEARSADRGGRYYGLRTRGVVSGGRAGIYVGEGYSLVVPSSQLFDEARAEFTPEQGGPQGALCVLHLQRAFTTVEVVLRSIHAGTSHWAAELPLPTSVQFRVVHARLGVVVASGHTNAESRATFDAAEYCFLVGEEYR